MNATTIQCSVCESQMEPKSKRNHLCSERCRQTWTYWKTCTSPGASERKRRQRSRDRARAVASSSYTCDQCGSTFGATKPATYCSAECDRRARMGPLRRAIEDGNETEALAIMLSRTEPHGACLNWTGEVKGGYGRVTLGKRNVGAHRLVAELSGMNVEGLTVHHACANRLCVNPSHLQVVTRHENTAEMYERTSYQRRIADLEDALRTLDPDHPTLCIVMQS